MNFLAHIYLSGDNDLVKIGNFSADGIRGKDFTKYPEAMQAGIILHRFIDSYTDTHPIFKKSTKRLHSNYGHYSGVIVDIFYDHFLAKNWETYHIEPLDSFASNFYDLLNTNFGILPDRIKNLTPHMIAGNWLLNYAKIEGIQDVLNGMNRRTRYKSKMNEATKELQLYYDEFENEFSDFFIDLKTEANTKRKVLENEYNL